MKTMTKEGLRVLLLLYLTTREKNYKQNEYGEPEVVDEYFFNEWWDEHVNKEPDYSVETHWSEVCNSRYQIEAYMMFRRFCNWSRIPGFDRCCIDSCRDEYYYSGDMASGNTWWRFVNHCGELQSIAMMMIVAFIQGHI